MLPQLVNWLETVLHFNITIEIIKKNVVKILIIIIKVIIIIVIMMLIFAIMLIIGLMMIITVKTIII